MNRANALAVAKAFGTVLRTVRREARMKQEVLADKADLDRTYPSLLERGLRQPTLSVLLAISAALSTNPSLLVNLTMRRLEEDPTKPV